MAVLFLDRNRLDMFSGQGLIENRSLIECLWQFSKDHLFVRFRDYLANVVDVLHKHTKRVSDLFWVCLVSRGGILGNQLKLLHSNGR